MKRDTFRKILMCVHADEFRVYVDHHGNVDMQLESTEPHYKISQTDTLMLIAELSMALMRRRILKGEKDD